MEDVHRDNTRTERAKIACTQGNSEVGKAGVTVIQHVEHLPQKLPVLAKVRFLRTHLAEGTCRVMMPTLLSARAV
jgi:hypothetical protein